MAPEAVQLAQKRILEERGRLEFFEGYLDHLAGLTKKFNSLLSSDTLYMPNQLVDTLGKMHSLLEPDGQMLIFYSHYAFQPGGPREHMTLKGNALGHALEKVGLLYQTWDFSQATFHLMRHNHQLALEKAADFAAEGSEDLSEFLLAESGSGKGPYDPDSNPYSRYLYRIAC